MIKFIRNFINFIIASMRMIAKGNIAYYCWLILLLILILQGGFAYLHQFEKGLIVTNMRDQVSWAFCLGSATMRLFRCRNKKVFPDSAASEALPQTLRFFAFWATGRISGRPDPRRIETASTAVQPPDAALGLLLSIALSSGPAHTA